MKILSPKLVNTLLESAKISGSQQASELRPWADPAPNYSQTYERQPLAISAPQGVERRLSRRAEHLWLKLAGEHPLPSFTDLKAFAVPPFHEQSLLVEVPFGGRPCVTRVGRAIADTTYLTAGPAADIISLAVPLGARLVSLGRKSAMLNGIRYFENSVDKETGTVSGSETSGHALLMRAIALPFIGTSQDEDGSSALVIVSWRRLLSQDETIALERELEAAMKWIRHQGT